MPLVTTEYRLRGQLEHEALHITYTTFERVAGSGAEPDFVPANTLHITHADLDRTLTGGDITTVDTAIGELVTLELFIVPDLGATTLAFLVPDISAQLDNGQAPLHSVAIESLRKSSFAPQLDVGQVRTYTTVHLHGEVHRTPALVPSG